MQSCVPQYNQNVSLASKQPEVILLLMRLEQYPAEANMQIRVKENTAQFGKCGCGRSPTGYCIGWHGLNEQQLKEAQEKYQAQQLDNK
jgi:hypothetical protein